ncbi:conserved protein, unknown function [Hepatocystis sp. ex Piliocolobus tephrosceles]|nr:conserved protein, unknown function [Hepatocystis sp. ex Piliocolobus tephrosceles]
MIIKRKKKTLTRLSWLALIILPSVIFKSLSFDNIFSLHFDKLKKKIHSRHTVNNFLAKTNPVEVNHYLLNNNLR